MKIPFDLPPKRDAATSSETCCDDRVSNESVKQR
jgi:hypothetical protein